MERQMRMLHLREFLAQIPTSAAFTDLCRYVESWPPDGEYAVEVDYLTQHLRGWPDELRNLSDESLARLCEHPTHPSGCLFVSYHIPSASALNREAFLSVLAALPHLRRLRLDPFHARSESVAALRASGLLDKIETLALGSGAFDAEAIRPLLKEVAFGSLKHLSLRGQPIDASLLREVVPLPIFACLESLDLSLCQITDEGLRALCEGRVWRGLRTLCLNACGFGSSGIQAIQNGRSYGDLRRLELRYNVLGREGVSMLAACETLSHLESLWLDHCDVDVTGLAALLASTSLASLREVGLCGNGIGDEGAYLLAQSERIHAIERLDLRWNGMSEDGLCAIQASMKTRTAARPSVLQSEYNHGVEHVEPSVEYPLQIRAVGRSQTGPRRYNNEDLFLLDDAHQTFAVIDGMGGYDSGDFAAQLVGLCVVCNEDLHRESTSYTIVPDGRVQENVMEYLGRRWQPRIHGQEHRDVRLFQALCRADIALWCASSFDFRTSRLYRGGGATCVAIAFLPGRCCILHAGMDRAYRWRANELRLLTRDHSLVQEMIDAGMLSPEEANHSPYRNVVIKGLGFFPMTWEFSVYVEPVERGDLYLLCSDGWVQMFEKEEIEELLWMSDATLDARCERLMQAALQREPSDNLTIVLVEIV